MSDAGPHRAPPLRVRLEGAGAEATLVVALLPKHRSTGRALREVTEEEARRCGTERAQLLEAVEYRYAVEGLDGDVTCGPEAVFTPDDEGGRTGRLRPGLHVGRMELTVRCGERVLRGAVEVQSRKVDYLRDYRAMLRDLAAVMTEVVMQGFAASALRFASDTARDAPTLYQRFALLRSLLDDGTLDAALRQVVAHPHRRWVRRREAMAPGRPLPSGSHVARQLARPGPRRPWPGAHAGATIDTLPLHLDAVRTEETLDTAENRFVGYALRRWLSLLDDLRVAVDPGARAEVDALADVLSAHLRHPMFAELGALQRIPAESQVLQKREGYREVFRLFFVVEAAATLAWTPDEGTWHAGVRDVAALYEHWVYLRLAGVLARVCGATLDPSALLREDDGGVKVSLRRGDEPVLTATVTRHGRPIDVALYYNRSFAGSSPTHAGPSWTRGMRPDCSLRVAPRAPDAEAVWLHFDAKYRIEAVTELFGGDGEPDVVTGRSQRDDLAKMHAYRDAIRRTAGAFVVYPGTEPANFERYHELLPGLGAFPLAPSGHEGSARGEANLEDFVRRVFDHVARRATQHERWRYWTSQIFAAPPRTGGVVPLIDERPPADVGLLVAAVKGAAHLAWVRKTMRYNLRADGRVGSVALSPTLLAARYVLLHGAEVAPTLWRLGEAVEGMTGEGLAAMGYPEPGGTLYLVLRLEAELSTDVVPSPEALSAARGGEEGSRSVPVLRTMAWLFGLEDGG
ncbi:MAG: DUF2357 domain-containing protein [Polyangiales bacterium]